jgi:predicted DCC family thiol-disulfide oxidoreductase YuxK
MKTSSGAIYFDGLCLACSAEINHYKKLAGSQKFQFIDITDSNLKAKQHGLDPALAHKVMHVKDPEGQLHQGVDAFRAIWKELPRYQFLYALSEKSYIRPLLNIGYELFVQIRPFLPRKKYDCSASPYCEVKHD